jgi:diguanylate cyclase (GGDEF)-like protein
VIAGLIATVVLTGWVGLRLIERQLVEQSGATLALAASDLAHQLDQLMAERVGDIQLLATSDVVQQGHPAAITARLLQIQEAYPVYAWLGITDARGAVVAATDPASMGYPQSERACFQHAPTQQGISIVEVVLPEANGRWAVSIAAPIRGAHGEVRGAACGLVGLPMVEDALTHSLVPLQAHLGTAVRLEYQIVGRDGTLLVDSLLREEGRVNLQALALPSVVSAKSGQSGWIEEVHARRAVPVVTGYATTRGQWTAPSLNWTILVRADRADVLKPIHRFVGKLAIGAGLVAVLLHGTLVWLLRRLHRECRRNRALVGQLQAANAHLEELAQYDPLTGLANRRGFLDRLTQAIAQARHTHTQLAVLFLDLDHFKAINNSLGHSWGDCLLTAFAARLKGCVRESDTVARLGGDEFTVLLIDLASPEEAVAVAHRIREAMAQPFVLRDQPLFLTTSIGIALYPSDGEDQERLLTAADLAMYEAKAHGGEVKCYMPTMNGKAVERLALSSDLQLALPRNQFALQYQPQVDGRTGVLVGLEALLRWQHPTRGLIPPGDFIPLAEQNGLIVPIGQWVLRTALTQAKAWQVMGSLPLRIAVNLSCRQLEHSDLVNTLASLLQETDVPPSCLELELTESLLANRTPRIVDQLHALGALGIRLAIDDFGTGYSALNYLRTLPVHVLKLDQSFVRALEADRKTRAIVRGIIGLAQDLGLEVIAEGVETEAQVTLLRELGCVLMQGYYFGRPAPAEVLTARILQRAGDVLVP